MQADAADASRLASRMEEDMGRLPTSDTPCPLATLPWEPPTPEEIAAKAKAEKEAEEKRLKAEKEAEEKAIKEKEKADKEETRKRDIQERKDKREQARLEEQEKKRRYKESAAGKASKWMEGVEQVLRKLRDNKDAVQTSKMPADQKGFYVAQTEKYCKQVTSLRGNIEQALARATDESNHEKLQTLLENATTLMQTIQDFLVTLKAARTRSDK